MPIGPQSTQKNPGEPGYGITKNGAVAGPGTIAAPPGYMGDTMFVPGYGKGVVQDIGGKIKGNHIDVWFPSVGAAMQWGNPHKDVIVCKPRSTK